MKQLTAHDGQKEWQYEGKIYVAVPSKDGGNCGYCAFNHNIDVCFEKVPDCTNAFDVSVDYIEKPAK